MKSQININNVNSNICFYGQTELKVNLQTTGFMNDTEKDITLIIQKKLTDVLIRWMTGSNSMEEASLPFFAYMLHF